MLLAYARSAAIDPARLKMIDLEPVIMAAIDRIEPQAGVRRVTMVPPEWATVVKGDASLLEEVFLNLLANAVRYTTHGGVRVRMSAQLVNAGCARLRVVISDTGAGISRSRLALILGREGLSTEGEGPGLGLAISLRLAKLMGGKLTAKSELGEGSEFTLVLDGPVAVRSVSAARV